MVSRLAGGVYRANRPKLARGLRPRALRPVRTRNSLNVHFSVDLLTLRSSVLWRTLCYVGPRCRWGQGKTHPVGCSVAPLVLRHPLEGPSAKFGHDLGRGAGGDFGLQWGCQGCRAFCFRSSRGLLGPSRFGYAFPGLNMASRGGPNFGVLHGDFSPKRVLNPPFSRLFRFSMCFGP